MDKEYIKASIDDFMNTIDGDYQMNFAEEYAKIGDHKIYGGKHAGSDAETKGAKRIYQELIDIGISNVELIEVDATKFQFNDATLTVVEETEYEIKPYAFTSPGTGIEGICSQLVDSGKAEKSFFDAHDVKGKVVLIEGMGVLEGASLSAQILQAERRSAAAVVVYMTEDMLNDETIRVQPMNHVPQIPVVVISIKDAKYLKKRLKDNTQVDVILKVDSEFIVDGGKSYCVVGEITGESDERIIYSSHLDHYFRCMQDNISAVVTLLEIAKAMVRSGYKPKRTITFIFNSCHETGLSDSRYPYISGSWQVLDKAKPQWCDKALLDINFEYSALKLDTLAAFASYEINKMFEEFANFYPFELKAFKNKDIKCNRGDYSLFSWADTISYLAKGIPVVMNDSIHEQIYEGTSPYIGRDHSNHDNMETFDKMALVECTGVFGAFGIYADNMPVMPIEFSERAESLQLCEEDTKLLESMKIDFSRYEAGTKLFYEQALSLREKIAECNECENAWSCGSKTNTAVKAIFKKTVDAFDKISPQDFITTGHSKYITNINLLRGASDALKAGNAKAALSEYLQQIDIVAWSKHFDKDIVDYGKSTICGDEHRDRRLWARGRELTCLTLYELITTLNEKLDSGSSEFDSQIEQITDAIDMEKTALIKCLADESNAIEEITREMEILLKEIV